MSRACRKHFGCRGSTWLILVLLPALSVAGSNLAGEGYPGPDCGDPPARPDRPEKFQSKAALEAYNEQAERYNSGMERYLGCVQTWLDNAGQDVTHIRALMNDTVRRVNQ